MAVIHHHLLTFHNLFLLVSWYFHTQQSIFCFVKIKYTVCPVLESLHSNRELRFALILTYHRLGRENLLKFHLYVSYRCRHSLTILLYQEKKISWILTAAKNSAEEKMMIFPRLPSFFLALRVKLVLYGTWCMIALV